jgi:histidyl-tRNA synthetase
MIQRLRGTRDFTPVEMAKRNSLEAVLRKISAEYGFREIQTPVMESSELFVLKSGPGILEEMYAFEDKGGRKISLRPELTAPIIRFFVNELSNYPLPLKVFCISDVFRYEEPQSGRYREFAQYDVESIGSDRPEADAELLILASDLCSRLGLKNVNIRIGHVGIIREKLDKMGIPRDTQADFLRLMDKRKIGEATDLLLKAGMGSSQSRELIDLCQTRGDGGIARTLKGEKAEYLLKVVSFLEATGTVSYEIDMGVVRGLDYYTGIVFEIDANDLGAEKQICGGGSYELTRLFGGNAVPSTGFAFGFDRLILAMEKAGWKCGESTVDCFVLAVSDEEKAAMLKIATALRRKGIGTEIDLMGRNMSKGLKYASARGAKFSVIVGGREIASGKLTVRDMDTGKQEEVPVDSIAEYMLGRTGQKRISS